MIQPNQLSSPVCSQCRRWNRRAHWQAEGRDCLGGEEEDTTFSKIKQYAHVLLFETGMQWSGTSSHSLYMRIPLKFIQKSSKVRKWKPSQGSFVQGSLQSWGVLPLITRWRSSAEYKKGWQLWRGRQGAGTESSAVPEQGKQSRSGDNKQSQPQSRSSGISLVQGRSKVKWKVPQSPGVGAQGPRPESHLEICFFVKGERKEGETLLRLLEARDLHRVQPRPEPRHSEQQEWWDVPSARAGRSPPHWYHPMPPFPLLCPF